MKNNSPNLNRNISDFSSNLRRGITEKSTRILRYASDTAKGTIKGAVDAIISKTSKVPPSTEIHSRARGDYITGTWNLYPYNPDELIVKKGYSVLDEMRTDDQIRSVMTMKKFARLAPGWDVRPASIAKSDIQAANFCRWSLQNLSGTFENRLLQILTSLDYGFSVSEINWEHKKEKGHKYNGRFILKSIKPRRPHYILFYQDDSGNLEQDGIAQEQLDGTIKRMPSNKFLRHTYQEEWDNLYGTTDYKSFYREWWIKTVILKFYAMYLERFPFPPTIGWYPPGTSATNINALEDILERLQVASTATLPLGITIDQLEISGSGSASYKEAILLMNKGITRGALCPDLLGFTETSSRGSYALGKKHFDVFLWILTELGKDLGTIITEQLLTQLIQFNFDAQTPIFIMPPPDEDLTLRSKVLDILIKGQVVDPKEEWVRDYMDVPQKDTPYRGRYSMPSASLYQDQEIEKSINVETFNDINNELAKSGNPSSSEITETFPYRRLTRFEEATGINFSEKQNQFSRWIDETSNDVKNLLYKEIKKLFSKIEGIYKSKNYKAAREIKLNPGSLRDILTSHFLEAYLESKLNALDMVEKSLKERIRFSEQVDEQVNDQNSVSEQQMISIFRDVPKPEELIATFRKRIPLTKGEWTKIQNFYRSKSFTVAGQIQKDIVSQIQELIYRAINEDWLLEELLVEVERVGITYTGRAWNYPPETPMKPWHTELVLRNAAGEIYNSANRALFFNSHVDAYVPALQYSAILDTRTRETHRELDGKIYDKRDPIWREIWPPNGHNCRCLVIPVTSNLSYSVSMPTDIKADPGFGKPR